MEYLNDRNLLVLLSYIESNDLTKREQKLLLTFNVLYSDNHLYEKSIKDDLYSKAYLSANRTTSSNTGAVVLNNYTTTDLGRKAIFSGRFPSEYKTRKQERFNLFIGWGATIIGSIGGILGILSFFL